MIPLALCRFAHFLAAMLAFGMSAYLWAYAPERLRLSLSPVVRRLALIASLVALISAIAWLALESASMADDWSAAIDPGAIGAVLTDTAFGLHVGVASRTGGGAGRCRRLRPERPMGGDVARVCGAAGEPRPRRPRCDADRRRGRLHRANHAVHLMAAGAWIGGLVPFAMCLRAYERDDLRKDAVRAMAGFSFWGQLIVAAIVLTGVVNIALTSHHPPVPPTTPYRALLVAKLVIVATMILLALFNRFVLAPRLKASANALATLRATSLAEIALGCIVIALVSVFALLRSSVKPGASRASQHPR